MSAQDLMREACEADPPDWLTIGCLTQQYGPEVVNLYILDPGDEEGHFVRSPLHLAAEHGKPQYILLLVARGADVFAVDCISRTPIHVAVSHYQHSCVSALLRAGAHPAPCDDHQITPMHYAAGLGCIPIMEDLMHAGARMCTEDEWGCLPVQFAIAMGQQTAVEWLVRNCACHHPSHWRCHEVVRTRQPSRFELHPFLQHNDIGPAMPLHDVATYDDLVQYAADFHQPEIANLLVELRQELSAL